MVPIRSVSIPGWNRGTTERDEILDPFRKAGEVGLVPKELVLQPPGRVPDRIESVSARGTLELMRDVLEFGQVGRVEGGANRVDPTTKFIDEEHHEVPEIGIVLEEAPQWWCGVWILFHTAHIDL